MATFFLLYLARRSSYWDGALVVYHYIMKSDYMKYYSPPHITTENVSLRITVHNNVYYVMK